ncbi:MAG: TonB-dependent receptor, partial [Pseudarcicella sp.]|nr:TonB-dependent receptor [Pseudarcicella sp.]
MVTEKKHCPQFLKKSFLVFSILLFHFTGLAQTITGKLVDGLKKEPIVGASIRILGTNSGSLSNEKGEFVVVAKDGEQILVITSVGYPKMTRKVNFTKKETLNLGVIEFEVENQNLNEVVILGTRRSDRTVLDSPVPIDIIGAKEIQSTGATQTIEMLQALIPSFNTFKNSITDATDYVRPAQLRGLGPEHVLVLVNGKRRHTSSVVHDNEQARGSVSVDLNSIPPSAIERIEVLRDGAAAQYGSDAIAGVINLVLKKSTDLEVTLNYGQN